MNDQGTLYDFELKYLKRLDYLPNAVRRIVEGSSLGRRSTMWQKEKERDPTILGTEAWRNAKYFAWEVRQQDPNIRGTPAWRNAYAIERMLEDFRL